jgi:hypothetical protein
MTTPVATALRTTLLFLAFLTGAGLVSAAVSPVSEALVTVNVRHYGARGDGVRDDTAALRRAMRAVEAAGGGTVRLPKGTYRVRPVTVPPGVSLLGDGPARSWLRGRVTANRDMTFSRLKIGVAGRAFTLAAGTERAVFRRCRFVGGGGMQSGQDQGVVRLDAASARNVTFEDCVIARNSRNGNGVSIAETPWGHYENIRFVRCRILGQPRMNFECIQRGGQGYRSIDLIDCVIDAGDSQSVSYDGGGYSRIEGCTFRGAGKVLSAPWPHDLEINGSRGMVVTGNTFWSSRGSILNLNGVTGDGVRPGDSMTISGNVFTSREGVKHTASWCWANVGKSGILITGNKFTLGAGSEVFYVDGPRNEFSGNTIRVYAGSRGRSILYVEDAPGTVADRNTVRAPGSNITVRGSSAGSAFRDNVFVTGATTEAEFFRIARGLSVTLSGNTYE